MMAESALHDNQLQHDGAGSGGYEQEREVLLSQIAVDVTGDFKSEGPAQEFSDENDPSSLPTTAELAKQAWAWACWSGEKTWDGLDFAGEVVANFLGLTRSKYQWMLDMQEREEEDRRLRKLEARQRRQLRLEQLLEEEKRKLEELEARYDNQDELEAGGSNQDEFDE